MLKVIGYQVYKFTPTGESTPINGVTLYTTEQINSDKGQGLMTGKLSLSDSFINKNGLTISNLLGKEIEVLFNKYGKPQEIHIIK